MSDHDLELFEKVAKRNTVLRRGSSYSTKRKKSKNDNNSKTKLCQEVNDSKLDSKNDCCAFVIHCTKHDKIAVQKIKSNCYWLPYTALPYYMSWNDGAIFGSLIVLAGGSAEKFETMKDRTPPYSDVKCMQIFRRQLPQSLGFITRLIYYIKLDPNFSSENFKCCTNTKRTEWLPLTQIVHKKVDSLWGPELVDFCCLISPTIVQQVSEYSLEEALMYLPRDPPRNLEEMILKSIKITEKDVERLYADFLNHCFPSFYESFESFKDYMMQYDLHWKDINLTNLFHAFNYQKNGYLSFHELLIGLALIEPYCAHGELRAKFIFRYYDSDNDGYLSREEMTVLVSDIYPKDSKESINKKVNDAFSHEIKFKTIHGKDVISLDYFCYAIGSHKFRGTSGLCRASKPIFPQILRLIVTRTVKTGANTSMTSVVFNRNYKGTCKSCKSRKYELATHAVYINLAGYFSRARQLLDLSDVDQVKPIQKRSVELVFNPKYAANLIIEMVRSFNLNKGTTKNPKGLMTSQPEQLYKLIEELFNQVMDILKNETKCKKVSSPCFIIGDIHGNIEDLLSLEKCIWRRIPCIGSNYLFLGDYVDRGHWSLECALYLIAFKVLSHQNVTLLRGNHEVRALQCHYTYKRECFQKYGKEWGEKIWDITNTLFDHLPVCAVVDDRVFCAHGGIPRSTSSIEEITKLEKNISDPLKESSIVWEILWSDPCHIQHFNDLAEVSSNSTEDIDQGFIKNNKRGTAFLFNEIAVKNFFDKNNLSHIIRAHEVPPLGYTFHFGNRCATIFSCSHYCGNNNDCACVLADSQTLRVIHLDTVNNSSATDNS